MAESSAPPARPAIIVPGFGVTRLYDPVTRRYVWGTPRATMRTRYADDLDLPPSGRDRLEPRGFVGSRGPVNIAWQLQEGLRKFGRYTPGLDVIPFAYDWRLPAEENAAKLRALIESVRRGGDVDVITHSAGAIVVLAAIKLQGDSHVANLVMIAPTRHGVIDAFRVFVRPERFVRRTFTPEMVATWPFVYELLPSEGRVLVDERGESRPDDVWSWPGFSPPLAARARLMRGRLRDTPMPAGVRTTVIAGDCVATARRVLLRRDGSFAFYPEELRAGEQDLAKILFEPGDGTVPVSSAAPDGEALLFCDGHQGIVTDPNVVRAVLRALRR
jgi:Lecithin:cholesterol acyltransferase